LLMLVNTNKIHIAPPFYFWYQWEIYHI